MNLNEAAITTRSILCGKKRIDIAFHYEDDALWEFRNSKEQDEEFILLSLEEILRIDKSIESILDMELGHVAQKKDSGLWVVNRL